ncbi:g11353 [Coccomyxa elongata]
MDANAPVVLPAVASRDLVQEIVRTALSALYEAASHQSDRIAKLELDVKQKANKEDVNVALAQKASAFDVASRLKQLQNSVTAKADEGVMEEQREGMEAALQASTSSLGSLLDTKMDSSQIKSWLEQVDDRISMVEESQIGAEQATAKKLIEAHAELDARLAALQADVDVRLAKEMGHIEFNCSAAMGEMVSAGIEQIGTSSAVAGEATRALVEELKQQLLADVAALKVEATQLNTKTLTKLNAAMEQSRSLKAWREQQNLRILEMQAALTDLDNRHKAAAARTEKALEAATRELRAETAAAQKAEARRLEAMLEHSTSLLRQTSVLGLATTRATIVNDLESLRGEMEELKAEALSSRAGSMRGPSPTDFQAFQSRLHRAGYETAQELPEKEQQSATGTLSSQSEQALDQPEVSMQDSLAKLCPLEAESTSCSQESVAVFGTKRHPENIDIPTERGHLQTSDFWEAPAPKEVMPSDTGENESAAEQKQSFTEGKAEGAESSQATALTSCKAHSNEASRRLSEHAASVGTALNGVPVPAVEGILTDAEESENSAEPNLAADVTAMSAAVMSAGADDRPAQSAVNAFVDRITDSQLAEAPDQEYGLSWPGLSYSDLAGPERVPTPAEAGMQPLRPSTAEDEPAPREVDARCAATTRPNKSTKELQQNVQDAYTGSSAAEGQQVKQDSNAVQPEAAVARMKEGSIGQKESTVFSADVRHRCDEALLGGGERPISDARTQLPDMRSVLSEDAHLNDSSVPVEPQKAVLRSSKIRSLAAAAPDDAWAIPVESSSSLAELQRMRAAMLAMQLATAQQASTSASLQQRVHDLENILRSETASLHSPSELHATRADIHQHWRAAIATGSFPERRPYKCGNVPIMRQLHGRSGVAAASDAASREVEAHSSCEGAVPEPSLACLHAQQ